MELKVRVAGLAVGRRKSSLLKDACHAIELTLEGVAGDKHAGFTRAADGRDVGVKRGTPVRNWRQWSAVSVEELARIAAALGIDSLDPALLGANITFQGCDSLTSIPKGSMIWFPSGAVLAVEGENAPCIGPGKAIAQRFPQVKAAHFPKLANKLRGLVGVVYKPGVVTVGDQAIICCYEHEDALPMPPRERFA